MATVVKSMSTEGIEGFLIEIEATTIRGQQKTIISLAPGNRRKRGSHYDLGMTIALLQQTDQICAKNMEDYAFVGELSLNGRLRPCYGILPMVTEAMNSGIKKSLFPLKI